MRRMALGLLGAGLLASAAMAAGGKTYQVTGPVVDAEAPFTHCILLPIGQGPERSTDSLALASHFLVSDLTTPLGRSADASRTGVVPHPFKYRRK